MIGVAIYDILYGDTDVEALVGTKIYPMKVKESDSVPYITYQEISNTPSPSKDSVSLLDRLRIQVSSFATKHEDAFSLAKKVRTALDRTSGIYSSSTFIVDVKEIDYDGEIDLGITAANVFERAQDYIIFAKEHEGGIGLMIIETDFIIT